jgi:cytochrome c peroxidase
MGVIGMKAEKPDVGAAGEKAFNDPSKTGQFKTPTLRDVALSAPYFHDGSVGTLVEVINHYDKGGIKRDSLSDDMKPLGLSVAEKQQLLAFLATLTSYEQVKVPALP